jgi:Pyruvate/2-oxoacid:ferredoxin oxidoreductase delta subunit
VLGQRLRSPFLLAASPFTGSYAKVRRAYEAGWAGAVMAAEQGATEALLRLRREFPDRLTLSWPEGPALGDPEDYRAAALLLSRGAPAVTVDALVRRHGLGIVNELQAGLSWLLAERGMAGVDELVGSAATTGATPIAGAHAVVDPPLCAACGSCARCPELAIALDPRGVPTVDPSRCTGCGLCVEGCFTGALALRPPGSRD